MRAKRGLCLDVNCLPKELLQFQTMASLELVSVAAGSCWSDGDLETLRSQDGSYFDSALTIVCFEGSKYVVRDDEVKRCMSGGSKRQSRADEQKKSRRRMGVTKHMMAFRSLGSRFLVLDLWTIFAISSFRVVQVICY